MSRRSTRLLSGGYYHSDEESDSSSVTTISYRENSVKVFKKKSGGRKKRFGPDVSPVGSGASAQETLEGKHHNSSENKDLLQAPPSDRSPVSRPSLRSPIHVASPSPSGATRSKTILQFQPQPKPSRSAVDSSGYSSSEAPHKSPSSSISSSGPGTRKWLTDTVSTLKDAMTGAVAVGRPSRAVLLARWPFPACVRGVTAVTAISWSNSCMKKLCGLILLLLLLLLLLLGAWWTSRLSGRSVRTRPSRTVPPAQPHSGARPSALDADAVSAAVEAKVELLQREMRLKHDLLLDELKQQVQMDLQVLRQKSREQEEQKKKQEREQEEQKKKQEEQKKQEKLDKEQEETRKEQEKLEKEERKKEQEKLEKEERKKEQEKLEKEQEERKKEQEKLEKEQEERKKEQEKLEKEQEKLEKEQEERRKEQEKLEKEQEERRKEQEKLEKEQEERRQEQRMSELVSALQQLQAHSESAAASLLLRLTALEEQVSRAEQRDDPPPGPSPLLSPELEQALDVWLSRRLQDQAVAANAAASGASGTCGTCGTCPLADKMADFALESQGASVVSTRCSETYRTRSACVSLFGLPLWYPSESPRTVIQGPAVLLPGKCWAFHGVQGTLVIALSHPIRISHVSLDHLPRHSSPTGRIDSAPKDFQVYGMTNETEQGTLLGTFRYDDYGGPTQTFSLSGLTDAVYHMVELRVLSNWGHVQYTCVYRFRVHGQLAST